jgi:hypothetical protein
MKKICWVAKATSQITHRVLIKKTKIMARAKKTAGNPPASLVSAVIRLSESKTWDEAKNEWEFRNYYYTDKYKACRCSPKGMNNITIMINKINGNQLAICNSCAEFYFGFTLGSKIESSARRTKKDATVAMNPESLEYLLAQGAISFSQFEDYDIARDARNNTEVIKHREGININLINFTDYNNKTTFDKIDAILFEHSKGNTNIDINAIIKIRIDLLDTGKVDMEVLDNTIEANGINIRFYNNEEMETARDFLDKYMRSKYFRRGAFHEYHRKAAPPIELNEYGIYWPEEKTRKKYFDEKNDPEFAEKKAKKETTRKKEKPLGWDLETAEPIYDDIQDDETIYNFSFQVDINDNNKVTILDIKRDDVLAGGIIEKKRNLNKWKEFQRILNAKFKLQSDLYDKFHESSGEEQILVLEVLKKLEETFDGDNDDYIRLIDTGFILPKNII